MNDLISRDAAIHAVDGIKAVRNESWYSFYQKVLRRLNILPPAEPEQKAGYWIMDCYVWRCSGCGKNPTTGTGYVQGRNELFDYCPNCGAKMEVEKHE